MTRDRKTLDRQAAGAALESVGPGRRGAGAARGRARRSAAQRRRRGPRPEAAGQVLHVAEPEAAWLLELAHASGLLDVGGPHRDEWLPTRTYDIWREQDLPDRWAVLAAGWLTSVRLPSLVGQRDVAGKAVNPLSPDLVRHTAPAIRRSALTVLAEFPAGAGLAPDDLVALLRWRTPRRADRLAPVPAMLAEAARLGAAGRRRPVDGGPRAADLGRGRGRRRHARPAARAGRPRAGPARPLADRAGPAGVRARRHPRRRRRRRVVGRGHGVPGVGLQRPPRAGLRVVGHATCTTSSPGPRARRCRRRWTT